MATKNFQILKIYEYCISLYLLHNIIIPHRNNTTQKKNFIQKRFLWIKKYI